MKYLTAVLAAMLAFPLLAAAQNAGPATTDLGPNGEITRWLALGCIPLAITQPTFDKDMTVPGKVLDADLLAGTGGESKVAAVGGQKVKIAASAAVSAPVELTWQLARTAPARVIYGWCRTEQLFLFPIKDGKYQDRCACYLYCQLISPADVKTRFLVGSRDSLRIVLNGKVVHRFVGQRYSTEDDEEAVVDLHKGVNDLLVRVDNYSANGGFVDFNGQPLQNLKVQLNVPAGTTQVEPKPLDGPPWAEVIKKIPPVGPTEHQEFFGAHITRTLSLLESGAQTHRPVRIMFYGQSIEYSNWPHLLIQRLRERYPHTEIIAENAALGGWNVGALLRMMNHTVVRAKPDLVMFHAYQGTAEQWDRVIQTLRRETCAEIMIRTAHIGEYDAKNMGKIEDTETPLLRQIAQKYDAEFVDVRQEWIDYLKNNKLEYTYLLRDQIHLSENGSILMAQLYDRHFRVNMLDRSRWMNTIRSYNVLRPLEDRKYDEIVLGGAGWSDLYHGARAAGPGNSLKLKFTGNRVDLVLLPDSGWAKVLIDGKSPAAFNLFHGDMPISKDRRQALPGIPMRYHCGQNMLAERWELTFKPAHEGNTFHFTLRGSATGEDGEGTTTEKFTSKSGRIAIDPNDWRLTPDYKPTAGQEAPALILQIVPDFRDQVAYQPDDAQHPTTDIRQQYVTLADGLPPGEHELTLIPSETGSFSVQAVEVFNPPLPRK